MNVLFNRKIQKKKKWIKQKQKNAWIKRKQKTAHISNDKEWNDVAIGATFPSHHLLLSESNTVLIQKKKKHLTTISAASIKCFFFFLTNCNWVLWCEWLENFMKRYRDMKWPKTKKKNHSTCKHTHRTTTQQNQFIE